MISKISLYSAVASVLTQAVYGIPYSLKQSLRVESFINQGITGFNMVSSLIIGSETAVLIDMPMSIPSANVLASWIRNQTDKPLVAAFTTHHHVDHYLGASTLLSHFNETAFYASERVVDHIRVELPELVIHTPLTPIPDHTSRMRLAFGPENVSEVPASPTAYNNTFFTLSGHEDEPIHLINNLVFDTVDGTMFWIPSLRTLIAGDSVYHRTMHLWMADMDTKALSDAWLKTLDFITNLRPVKLITGHAGTLQFSAQEDIAHTRSYIEFFGKEISSKGKDFYTPKEIVDIMSAGFSAQLESEGGVASAMFLNNTAEKYGRGSTRLPDVLDMTKYNDTRTLQGWELKA
ncbi:Putative metallo-beta-lactamase, ribonuclease Z/Hydroxyacylglutathione hydrolase [Colletotrichum destructivum]|uniref:Metallo-beta-lactamase, ribonuclease Z/Hydroxyacylglutathione hydrolase n=1 Tax=Colletotrichum destructivum TaxID=34406 RepID=A0AAX4IC57_9PEZI|nr:Putative metallo-beta-lactamase, ribonuclease Z/Hydroxyacylglutathione hydrolase [Colletotrichum destructivum]